MGVVHEENVFLLCSMGAAYHSFKKWDKVKDLRSFAGNQECTLLYMLQTKRITTGARPHT